MMEVMRIANDIKSAIVDKPFWGLRAINYQPNDGEQDGTHQISSKLHHFHLGQLETAVRNESKKAWNRNEWDSGLDHG